uniref:Uncharacterized AAA domain-containing protein ycf46 n=1 Tax=Scytosiphon promiscuus TaxID=1403536 RepID=A0A6B7IKF3_9PHAE|nr:hypothetical protein SlomFM_067 [Scytosiphon promiscuus]QDM58353.1 hypothetical protein SlomFM_067 [Scytosiphon promiscuus]
MVFEEELLVLLNARYPIIYILTIEEDRLEYTIRNSIINKSYSSLYVWDFVQGYKLNPIKKEFAKRNPLEALEFIEKLNSRTPSIFILKDFKRFLKDLTVSRKLRNILQLLKVQPKTIIIIDSEVQIPNELKDHITILKFNLPTPVEIDNELARLSRSLVLKGRFKKRMIEKIIQACQGLSLEKIRRILGKAIVIYNKMDHNVIPLILKEKRQVISETELLEFWSVKTSLKDVGGAKNLKFWLNQRNEIFSERAVNYGLVAPRGLLLIGSEGTGKSLLAKAIAYEWKLPLLRLDIGRLFAGVVGESESRTREMIRITESLSPCVLWIDEMDKTFADSEMSLDGGTTLRVLGTLATWLAEKKVPVFVIATANDLHLLPLEIVRKGRFDEIFHLNIPNREDRELIFEIHLRRFRPETWQTYDTKKLSKASNKFSGAEIEQTIIEAMYAAFTENREFNTNDILLAVRKTVPMTRIDPLRAEVVEGWSSSGRLRMA